MVVLAALCSKAKAARFILPAKPSRPRNECWCGEKGPDCNRAQVEQDEGEIEAQLDLMILVPAENDIRTQQQIRYQVLGQMCKSEGTQRGRACGFVLLRQPCAPLESSKRDERRWLKKQVRDPSLKAGAEPEKLLAIRPHEDMSLRVNNDDLHVRSARVHLAKCWALLTCYSKHRKL